MFSRFSPQQTPRGDLAIFNKRGNWLVVGPLCSTEVPGHVLRKHVESWARRFGFWTYN